MLEDADIRGIQDLERRWLEEELEGNATAVLDFCTEEIIWMPPTGVALRGKAAVRAWLDAPSVRIEEIRLSNVRIVGHGLAAYKVADFQTRWIPAGSSHSVTSRGSHLWLLNRGTDSTWRVVLVAWSCCEDERDV